MKLMTLLVLLFTIVSMAWAAQNTQSQTPPQSSSQASRSQNRSARHQHMTEMHKQQMEAAKADLEKMKSSLQQMRANVNNISDANEKARWQANIDMWQTLTDHMDRMIKQMESMGPGRGPGMGPGMMGGTPPPTEKQPQ